MGSQADRSADEQRRRQGRQFGSAARRSSDQRHDRSRHGDAPRPDAERHRQHALRRLRPAAGLDHLQPLEPISCRHGGRSALLAGSAHPRRALRFHFRRKSDGRPADGARRRGLRILDRGAKHGGDNRGGFGAQPRDECVGGERPLGRLVRRGGLELARDDGPAIGLRSFFARPHAAQRQSSGAVRRVDDFIQSCLGPFAQ